MKILVRIIAYTAVGIILFNLLKTKIEADHFVSEEVGFTVLKIIGKNSHFRNFTLHNTYLVVYLDGQFFYMSDFVLKNCRVKFVGSTEDTRISNGFIEGFLSGPAIQLEEALK